MKICKDRLQISFILLSQFENFNFNFPWNHWKTIGFLVISGEVEVINSRNNRREIGDNPLDQKVMVERYRYTLSYLPCTEKPNLLCAKDFYVMQWTWLP